MKKLKTGFLRIMAAKLLLVLTIALILPANFAKAETLDSDYDGLTDYEELNIFFTDINNPDTDNDNWQDGIEAHSGWDPNVNEDKKLEKKIVVDLKHQELSFYSGRYRLGWFLISSGNSQNQTPPGDYEVLQKRPKVDYKGRDYYYPNTKWNLMFKKGSWGNFYIHGAYWHNKFGTPVSHGCVNVDYANMEKLYEWAELGTKISIIK